MMSIQSRCSSLAADNKTSGSTMPLSPLQIGSSPMTNRQRSRQGAKGKRKSKNSPGNDENCLNGTSPSRGGRASSRRLSAMSMSPSTPLRQRDEETPTKRLRRQSNGMEVVDLLGLSDMPTTPAMKSSIPPVDLLTFCADSAQLAHISQSVLLKSYLNEYQTSGDSLEITLSRMRAEGVDLITMAEFQKLCDEIEVKKKSEAVAIDPLLKYQVSERQ
jgi:hypothetical protein